MIQYASIRFVDQFEEVFQIDLSIIPNYKVGEIVYAENRAKMPEGVDVSFIRCEILEIEHRYDLTDDADVALYTIFVKVKVLESSQS